MNAFHLSFSVPNLEEAKSFYKDILQCSIDKDMESWVDIIFFGHQITIHQDSKNLRAKPLDHFGPILDKNSWLETYEQCISNNVEFLMKPKLKNEGTNKESGKFIILDPAKNIIEFKFYKHFENR